MAPIIVGIVFPRLQTARVIRVSNMAQAEKIAGLIPHEVDHGTVAPGIAIIASEHGLFIPPQEQHYFRIPGCQNLCAGSAVLYGFDERGKTIDLPAMPRIVWLPSRGAVERAIATGDIKRPHIGIGDDVIWRWPGPQPSAEGRNRLILKIATAGTTIIDGDTTISVHPLPKKPGGSA